jgi:UDP-glucose 4-epimerase
MSVPWFIVLGIAENDKLYFSSSCTVYGQAEKMPITEDASIQKRCHYGNTKQVEKNHTDVAKVSHINADPVRILTDRSNPSAEVENYLLEPQNLLPFITQTGLDYETWLPNA